MIKAIFVFLLVISQAVFACESNGVEDWRYNEDSQPTLSAEEAQQGVWLFKTPLRCGENYWHFYEWDKVYAFPYKQSQKPYGYTTAKEVVLDFFGEKAPFCVKRNADGEIIEYAEFDITKKQWYQKELAEGGAYAKRLLKASFNIKNFNNFMQMLEAIELKEGIDPVKFPTCE